jgi:hypothetical protein
MLLTGSTTLNKINSELKKLSDEEQKLLLIKLKKGELLAKAKLINQRVKKNKISSAKIVATVRKNRKQHGD